MSASEAGGGLVILIILFAWLAFLGKVCVWALGLYFGIGIFGLGVFLSALALAPILGKMNDR